MAEILKVNDTTVAKIGTQEVKQVFTSTQLAAERARLEEKLAEVKELEAVLKAQIYKGGYAM